MMTKEQLMEQVRIFNAAMTENKPEHVINALGDVLFAFIDAQQRQAVALERLANILLEK